MLVLIILGIGEIVLFFLFLNLNGNNPENTRTTSQDNGYIQGPEGPQGEKGADGPQGPTYKTGAEGLHNEQYKVGWLDFDGEMSDYNVVKKGQSYIVKAKSEKINGSRRDANVSGEFTIQDNNYENSLSMQQDGDSCKITVFEDARLTSFTLLYKYNLNETQETISRKLTIK